MLLKKSFWLFCICIGTLANSYLALRVITGDCFLFVRLYNYFLPWLGLLALISLCGAAVSKKRIIALINAPLPILIVFTYAPLFYNCCWEKSNSGHPLKVMSYNIHQLNREISKAAALIAEEKPDILLIQEIESHNFSGLIRVSANLWADESLHYEYESIIQQAVVSRYPLRRIGFSADKNRLLKVEAIAPQGGIILLNIHAFKYGWLDRHERMRRIFNDDVLPERGLLILGGDFNTTDQSETLKMMTPHLQNAQQVVGCGFNFSFPAYFFLTARYPIPPILRIDHILYSNHFRAVRAYAAKTSGGSDHYPVVAELALESIRSRKISPVGTQIASARP